MDRIQALCYASLLVWGAVVLLHGLYRSLRNGGPAPGEEPPAAHQD